MCIYIYIYTYVFFFFCNVLNIFLGCKKIKKMHVLIYFIDLFLFYVLYNHLFLIHVMDNALAILCKSCQ